MEKENQSSLSQDAAAAVELERAARKELETGAYVHTLSRPFQWAGQTYETLTFRWDTLTGADHLDIESEILMKGRTLVVPEYTGEYLLGMAVRACAERNEKGLRALDAIALKTLPLKDFSRICRRARRFLQSSGSLPVTAGSGSENDA